MVRLREAELALVSRQAVVRLTVSNVIAFANVDWGDCGFADWVVGAWRAYSWRPVRLGTLAFCHRRTGQVLGLGCHRPAIFCYQAKVQF
jgi:hypothetical protein